MKNKLGIMWNKLLWPNLRYFPGICLEGMRKTIKNLGLAGLRAEI
jgi:hypothetical protein